MSHHAVISYLASLHWNGGSVESYAECPKYFYKRTLVNNHTKYFLAEKTSGTINWAEPYWQHCGWIAQPWGDDIWVYTNPSYTMNIMEELVFGKPRYCLVSSKTGIPVLGDMIWKGLAEAIDHISPVPEMWDDGDTMPVDMTAAPPPLQWRYG